MKKVLIAGASGFIGKALIEKLLLEDDIHIVALSRNIKKSENPRVTWFKCDLFSLKDISIAMEGCETGFYLVHSMLPSANLSQGTFYDFDLILADNFIRAAKLNNLKHIIYLGGMIPPNADLSWHLKSRLEVEETLRNSSIKTTVLRAALIIGAQGSSFTILEKLVERLPIMICPAWTNTRSRPVALVDMINVLKRSLLEINVQGKIYDIAGPDVITYKELILKVAKKIKNSTKLISLNIIPLGLSRFWVSLVTGVSKDLVYPLVLSLKYEMLPKSENLWPHQEDLQTSLDDILNLALLTPKKYESKPLKTSSHDVRSIQRLVLPNGRDAEWVANEYFNWLPRFFSTLIKVEISGNRCTFYFFSPTIIILVLEKSVERSSPDRQLLYVVGGLLSSVMDRGRLEFREVLNRRYVMAALHEFKPSLPWFIYKWTQAIVHLIVMKGFGEYLKWHVISEKRDPK